MKWTIMQHNENIIHVKLGIDIYQAVWKSYLLNEPYYHT